MAINFLNNINLNQNEVKKIVIENQPNNEAAEPGVEGQLYFNTIDFQLKAWANGSWGNVGGGVTSVGASVPLGTALAINGTNPITSTGTLAFAWTGDTTQYVAGNGTLVTFPTNAVTSIGQGAVMSINNANPNAPIVNHADVSRTNDSDTQTLNFGDTFAAISSVTTSDQGHVAGTNIRTFTLPSSDNTTYTLGVSSSTSNPKIRLTSDGGIEQDVQLLGTANQIVVTGNLEDGTATFKFPTTISPKIATIVGASSSDVALTVIKDTDLQRNLTVGGAGSFVGQLTIPDGVVETSAVNLRQLTQATSGQGGFQGSYDAANNSPALTGVSNVPMLQGDYYAVSDAGNFLGIDVVAGDFIYANVEILANSNPPISKYTVVQSATIIATAAATDAGSTKGSAGFDSATFNVSANGWVQLDKQSNPYGASVVLDGNLDYVERTAGGDATVFTVDSTSDNVFGAGSNALKIKAEIVSTVTGETVYAFVSRQGGIVTFEFVGDINNGDYYVLLTYVGGPSPILPD